MLCAHSIVNNCYILQEKKGEDAFSEIWRASAMFSATNFLLRFLKPGLPEESMTALHELALNAYGVRHGAVIDVVELERYDGRMFISSEYDGQTRLRDIHDSQATFPLEHICRFILELAQGLDTFHQRGFVYGTLNAESVYVSKEAGVITELRFLKPGYAPLVGLLPRDDPESILENQGYLAPELKGASGHPVDPRADLYSLGVHLYRFITGLMPFRGQSALRALDKAVSVLHVSNALARRGVPPELMRMTVACLRKNPRQRYPSVVELVRDLKAFMDGRRMDSIRAGATDPLAYLEGLNKRRERPGAGHVVRTLDMAEYFRALSEGPRERAGTPISGRFPPENAVSGGNAFAGYAELEELESAGPEDDESLSADDYVAMSMETCSGEPQVEAKPDTAPMPAGVVPEPPGFRHGDYWSQVSTGLDAGASVNGKRPPGPERETVAATAAGAPVDAPVIDGSTAVRQAGRDIAGGTGPAAIRRKPSAAAANKESGETEDAGEGLRAPGVSWCHRSVRADTVATVLLQAFKSAARGEGTFRFLEHPSDPHTRSTLERVFALMQTQGTLVDVAPKGGAAEDFLRALKSALEAAVASRHPRERRRFAAKADKAYAGAEAALSMPADRSAEAPKQEDACISAAAAALVRLGTGARPAAVIVRDANGLDARALEYLVAVAALVPGKAMCVFAFFEDEAPVSWR
ncbi:MAG: protein kinase [Spirochaetes bacterium]|nr:protein kinase [Spirochaetota bacterium]